MEQIIFITALFIGAMVLAFAMVATATSTIHVAKRWQGGILQYFFYALFISNSVMTLLSGRNLTGLDLSEPGMAGNPIMSWSIRLTSLFLMLAALDQCVRFFRVKPHIEAPRAVWAIGIILFWLTNIVSPAAWSSHPSAFYYPWVYQPILMIGLICLSAQNAGRVVQHCRNATFLFCLLSLALAVARPSLAINLDYQRGLFSGLPRLSGLATHPVVMGMISASGIWCLVYAPFRSRRLMMIALLTCTTTLFLSQSKTTWLGFALALPVAIFYHFRHQTLQGSTRQPASAMFVALCASIIAMLFTLLSLQVLGVADGQLDRFTQSSLGSRMLSLTGRDIIWDVAVSEWKRSPVFGYGLNVFDFNYRLQIGMLFATDGHNQIFDALARAGIVGATGAAIYLFIITWMGLRYSNASSGLSLILAISLLARAVSEVPFVLTVTNLSDTAHYLLICVVASCLRENSENKPMNIQAPPQYSRADAKPC